MKIIRNKKILVKNIFNEKKLGFVPTMGSIHAGHISLVKRSIKECSKTLVSIYVNKQQFNKKKDFTSYPRVVKRDISIYIHKIVKLFHPSTRPKDCDCYLKNKRISEVHVDLCATDTDSAKRQILQWRVKIKIYMQKVLL